VNDLDYIKEQNIDPHFVADKIGQMYADMIFKFGYVHCDPHPGNVLVQKDEGGNTRIVLLDHGLYTVMGLIHLPNLLVKVLIDN
jgi:aarF domain-containing kinase